MGSVYQSSYSVPVWEQSVRATHDFLTEEDIRYFNPLILNEYLKAIDLFVVREDKKFSASSVCRRT